MKKKIYTLIRPVLDYEESETTFAAFLTREVAESARREIIDYWNRLKDELGERPNWETDEEWAIYEKWDDNFRETLEKSNWPYNSKEAIFFDFQHSRHTPSEAVQISEVPLF